MKFQRYWYKPEADVEFTWSEVEGMILFSEMHYDYKCKELSRGGILTEMRNRFDAKLPLRTGSPDDAAARRMATITVRLDTTTVDLLCKCVEQDPTLFAKLKPILSGLNNEWQKMNARSIRETNR